MLNYSNIKLGKWDLTDLVEDSSTKKFAELVDDIKKRVKKFEDNRRILKPDLSIRLLSSNGKVKFTS